MTTPSDQYATPDEFRQYVRGWMDANAVVPDDIPMPTRRGPLSTELKQWAVQFRRKLGAQGWIAPTWPREYGGGGLTNHHAAIIQQELSRQPLPPLQVSIMEATALRVYCSEEQKRTLLASLLRGEVTMAHSFNESDHGSDLSANTTSATRDADEYIINGRKDYITSILPPDIVLCLAITDPDAPPTQRFSIIAVDTDTPGVLIKPESLLVPGREYKFFYSDVPVPSTRIIGEEGQGIEIAEFMVEIERGGIVVTLDRQREIEEQERQANESTG
jgi:alkylation response protein AidB-like acyl-CoA dehydrogenase